MHKSLSGVSTQMRVVLFPKVAFSNFRCIAVWDLQNKTLRTLIDEMCQAFDLILYLIKKHLYWSFRERKRKRQVLCSITKFESKN